MRQEVRRRSAAVHRRPPRRTHTRCDHTSSNIYFDHCASLGQTATGGNSFAPVGAFVGLASFLGGGGGKPCLGSTDDCPGGHRAIAVHPVARRRGGLAPGPTALPPHLTAPGWVPRGSVARTGGARRAPTRSPGNRRPRHGHRCGRQRRPPGPRRPSATGSDSPGQRQLRKCAVAQSRPPIHGRSTRPPLCAAVACCGLAARTDAGRGSTRRLAWPSSRGTGGLPNPVPPASVPGRVHRLRSASSHHHRNGSRRQIGAKGSRGHRRAGCWAKVCRTVSRKAPAASSRSNPTRPERPVRPTSPLRSGIRSWDRTPRA